MRLGSIWARCVRRALGGNGSIDPAHHSLTHDLTRGVARRVGIGSFSGWWWAASIPPTSTSALAEPGLFQAGVERVAEAVAE